MTASTNTVRADEVVPVPSSTRRGVLARLDNPVVRWGLPVVAYGLFLLVVRFIEDPVLGRLSALMAFWASISMAWNLIGGYAGQVFLGNAAFVGLGSFTGVLLLRSHNISPWFSLIIAGVICAVVALLTGIPTLRLAGTYFSLATLAYPLVLQPIATWLGYREVLIPARRDELYSLQFRDVRWYAVILGALALLVWLFTVGLERSRWFVQLRAIAEDEAAARSAGVNSFGLKLSMFVASAVFSGMAGVVYAQLLFVITPDTVFGLGLVIGTLVICCLGGVGRKSGPLIGALLVIPAVDYLDSNLSHIVGASNLVYGLILMGVMLLAPAGIAGSKLAKRIGGRRILCGPPTPEEIEAARRDRSSALATSHGDERSGGDGAPLLRVEGVTKRYGEVVAVDDVRLTVREGEFLGIVGPNGAGKTTLFDLITGYQEPTAGRVVLDGTDVTAWRPDRRARAGVRRTFQVARPMPSLTLFENTLLGALHNHSSADESRAAALQALEQVGVLEQADDLGSTLVPSQLRLLELARALAGKPRLLLLDEPFAGLDAKEKEGFVQVLRDQWSRGLTIVMVDHDIRTVAATVERLFVIDNGLHIADGDPQTVIREPQVISAYLGSKWQEHEHVEA